MTAVGIDAQWLLPPGGAGAALARLAAAVVDAGLDHVNVGDHVSFRDGTGFDGLINATALLASHPTLRVLVGVYQVPARHPVLIARQLASIAALAPGRLLLGCGVGGEDPNELAMLGVDPATRGRRTDETLAVLRQLLAGETVDHAGACYAFERAAVLPAPTVPIPLLVGGRSDAALRRTAAHGDGWIGIWLSPERFGDGVERIATLAAARGRADPPRQHAMQFWCGFDDGGRSGADRLRVTMEPLYGLPYERFARFCPTGSPQEVAAAIAPYLDRGCRHVTLIPAALPADRAIALAAATAHALRSAEVPGA